MSLYHSVLLLVLHQPLVLSYCLLEHHLLLFFFPLYLSVHHAAVLGASLVGSVLLHPSRLCSRDESSHTEPLPISFVLSGCPHHPYPTTVPTARPAAASCPKLIGPVVVGGASRRQRGGPATPSVSVPRVFLFPLVCHPSDPPSFTPLGSCCFSSYLFLLFTSKKSTGINI